MMDIKKEVEKELDAMGASQGGGWVIEYKGKRIVLDSGKSVWKEKQHASSALTNHFSTYEHRKGMELAKVTGIPYNQARIAVRETIRECVKFTQLT